jgi:hypothetical protein
MIKNSYLFIFKIWMKRDFWVLINDLRKKMKKKLEFRVLNEMSELELALFNAIW